MSDENPVAPPPTEKGTILDAVARLATLRAVTRAEIVAAYERGSRAVQGARTHTKRLNELLYYVGGVIVLTGITVLVTQNWSTLSEFSRIAVTLGSAIVAFTTGVLLTRTPSTEKVGTIFFLLSGVLAPLGVMVTLLHGGYNPGTSGAQSIMSGILLLTYGLGRLVLRQNVLTLFGMLFGTWFFYGAATWLARQTAVFFDFTTYYEYLTLLVGLTHLSLGYAFKKTRDRDLTKPLYCTGLVAVLSASLALGGFAPNQNTVWELLFPGIVIGTVLLSIPLRSRVFLFFGAAYLVTYMFKITAEYFSNRLGWPLALVLVGFSIIGTGYVTWLFHVNYQKYATGP